MIIKVTEHAIKRYRERFFDYSSTEDAIKNLLIETARKGTTVCKRPGNGHCTELKYKDTYIVAAYEQDELTIITCLGNRMYRKWVKHQDSYERLGGRILYPEQAV